MRSSTHLPFPRRPTLQPQRLAFLQHSFPALSNTPNTLPAHTFPPISQFPSFSATNLPTSTSSFANSGTLTGENGKNANKFLKSFISLAQNRFRLLSGVECDLLAKRLWVVRDSFSLSAA
jgi:hypothetical protein